MVASDELSLSFNDLNIRLKKDITIYMHLLPLNITKRAIQWGNLAFIFQ